MRIIKSVVLSVLLISLLAFTSLSQISQVTDAITIEEKQDCTTTFYNKTENVYGYVTKTRNTYGTCFNPANQSYHLCINGTEFYQSYEPVDTIVVLKNTTECQKSNSYLISISKDNVVAKKELDFSSFGPCIYATENNCLVVTCVSKYDGAHKGQFTDCTGGKSCQKFEICNDKARVLYKKLN